MSLETASYVANLVASNPDGGDQRSTADDHIRLLKAALLRTFPKLDGAVSLSATQVMYLNDLSASVQMQLNALRDGPATANFAVEARFAQSASTAALIGTIPAARVPDLAATNVFMANEPLRLSQGSSFISWHGGAGRIGYMQMVDANAALINVEQSISFLIYVNGSPRLGIAPNGSVTIPGAITGTISNATNAVNATSAVTATTAASANTAAFATSAGSSALLSGLAPSDIVVASTIAQRNSSGDLSARYFFQNSAENENPAAISQFIVTNGDGYFRKSNTSNVGSQLECRNITGRTGTSKTISSSAPSGGSNGDIHYQY